MLVWDTDACAAAATAAATAGARAHPFDRPAAQLAEAGPLEQLPQRQERQQWRLRI